MKKIYNKTQNKIGMKNYFINILLFEIYTYVNNAFASLSKSLDSLAKNFNPSAVINNYTYHAIVTVTVFSLKQINTASLLMHSSNTKSLI